MELPQTCLITASLSPRCNKRKPKELWSRARRAVGVRHDTFLLRERTIHPPWVFVASRCIQLLHGACAMAECFPRAGSVAHVAEGFVQSPAKPWHSGAPTSACERHLGSMFTPTRGVLPPRPKPSSQGASSSHSGGSSSHSWGSPFTREPRQERTERSPERTSLFFQGVDAELHSKADDQYLAWVGSHRRGKKQQAQQQQGQSTWSWSRWQPQPQQHQANATSPITILSPTRLSSPLYRDEMRARSREEEAALLENGIQESRHNYMRTLMDRLACANLCVASPLVARKSASDTIAGSRLAAV